MINLACVTEAKELIGKTIVSASYNEHSRLILKFTDDTVLIVEYEWPKSYESLNPNLVLSSITTETGFDTYVNLLWASVITEEELEHIRSEQEALNREQEYKTYLRLKQEFEPEQKTRGTMTTP